MIKTQKKKRGNIAPDFPASFKSSKENTGRAAEATPECIRKTMKYGEIEVLRVNIRYPKLKLSNPAASNDSENYAVRSKTEKKINKFYDDIAKSFAKYSEGMLFRNAAGEYLAKAKEESDETEYGGRFKAFGASLNFEVTYNRGDLLCIYLDASVYTGKGRGNVVRVAHIWELSRGAPAPSKRFADLSGKNKKKICSRICAAIQSQMDRGEEYYTNSDFKSVYRHFKAKNMFITDRGCNFFFPQGSLSPPVCGIVSFIYS